MTGLVPYPILVVGVFREKYEGEIFTHKNFFLLPTLKIGG